MPVMVCMDGFILTHAFEAVEVPTQQQVDAFVPPYEPRQVLDPLEPVSIGAMVGPEAFEEVRYLAHVKQLQALDLIPEIAAEFAESFGRRSGGLVSSYRSEDADTVVVALGSVLGTIKDAVDDLRDRGERVGVVGHRLVPPVPRRRRAPGPRAVRRRVVVLEKALAPGAGGILATDVTMACAGLPVSVSRRHRRPRGPAHHQGVAHAAPRAGRRGRARAAHLPRPRPRAASSASWPAWPAGRRSGPTAENVLRDVGIVSARRRVRSGPCLCSR